MILPHDLEDLVEGCSSPSIGWSTASHPLSLPVRRVRSAEVEVSSDDGATWRKAPVSERSGAWSVQVKNPAGPGYVSLRGHAVDSAGDKVTMTVIRAYEFK